MNQLPGQRVRGMPRWLKTCIAAGLTLISTIWLLSLLPFLLLAALILSVVLIPVVRRLGREMEDAGFSVDTSEYQYHRSNVNITPWHRRFRNVWRDINSGKGR